MPATRRLIVNADDFGRSPGITRGILQAHRHGIVTSTTLMVALPWAAAAAELARATPRLGVGLHLSFCYGPPVADGIDSLLGADRLLERDLDKLRTRAQPHEIEREARAQLERFVALTGTLPTHLDSHQHVHTWPVASAVIAGIAREHGLPMRASDSQHATILSAAGVAHPDAFIAGYFGAREIALDKLVDFIRHIPTGTTELMCHPGYDDEALADSSYRLEREQELQTLTAPALRQFIEDEGISLISFCELHRAA